MNTLFKKYLLAMSIVFLPLFWLQSAWAALNAGDIAFVQYNSDNPDNFAFVALVDIPANEEVKFTDNGWKSDNTWRTGEQITTWTAPSSTTSAGTVISIENLTPSIGSALGSGLNLSTTGDQIIAFQNTDTMIAGLNVKGAATWQGDASSSNTSALPQGLTNGLNAVAITEVNNAKYTGTTTGNKATLLAAINNKANWTGDDSAQVAFSGSFTITGSSSSNLEPSNHPISFTAVVDTYSQITVSWTDSATGSQAPDGYLILCNAPGSFTDPVDGTPQADDTDCIDGFSGTKNVAHGSGGSYTWTGLDSNVRYYFKIFPYTYSGSNINYKIDSTPQTAEVGIPAPFCDKTTATHCIHEIQGSGATSPLNGTSNIIIEGIVTGDFQDGAAGVHGDLNGFYVQEEDSDKDNNNATSEGIFVYESTSPASITIGDKVQVKGRANEYLGLTELTDIISVTKVSSGNPLPAAAPINLPVTNITDFEPYEGMRVIFPQTLYVTSSSYLARYGEILLSANDRLQTPTNVTTPGAAANALSAQNELNKILLDDGLLTNSPDPTPHGLTAANTIRGGYSVVGATGILSFSSSQSSKPGQYRILPINNITFTANNPRTLAPTDVGGTLKVASFNVQNYFTTYGGSKGATNTGEFILQKDKITATLVAMNADIVGLVEIENSTAVSGIDVLKQHINGVVGTDVYDYIITGKIGTAHDIRVSLLYKTTTVRPVGSRAILDSSVDANFLDTKNRPSLAQTFEQIATGEKLTVVVNHLKSKVSDCDDVSDPDANDGQGNCNGTRTKAVTALKDWIATDPTSSGDPDFLLIGDFNAYAKEDPITALESAGYTNLVSGYSYGYGYNYIGEWGLLDYAFTNSSLHSQVTGATIWHINADEPQILDYNVENKSAAQQASLYNTDPYRSSDHDPVIVGLALGGILPLSTLPTKSPIAIAPALPDKYVLSVAGSQAHIKSNPSGIDCEYGQGTCSTVFDRGAIVQLELVGIKATEGLTFDDYDIEWFGDTGCQSQTVTMHDMRRCAVKLYGKQGTNYSGNTTIVQNSTTGSTNSDGSSSNGDGSNNGDTATETPIETNKLNFLNFSGHSLLRGGAEDVILGFILDGEGTADVTLHANILEVGVQPSLDVNEVLFDNTIGWYGNLLKRKQQTESFTFSQTVDAGVYTIQMSSTGTKGRGLAGISLKNNQLNLTNLSVRGYLQDALVFNFIVDGEGTQKVKINSHILSGQVSTQLQMINLATLESVSKEIVIAEGSSIEVSTGAYAIILNILSGQGIGMIEVDLQP